MSAPRGPKGHRASVGFALIAKNAEQTLAACLRSLRPYVQQIIVCVDETSTDKTAKVARRHGADRVIPIQVSDWHECPQHGRVLAQHFAKARNTSFTYLDRSLDFLGWQDADDEFVGGERLAEIVAGIPADAVGLWIPYEYARTENGQATTLFDRERILRSSVTWEWRQRVHETVAPLTDAFGGNGTPKWIRTENVRVVHQQGIHRTEASTTRNNLLLEIDLEDEPENPRTLFYLGNSFFAMGRWEDTIAWYERLAQVEKKATPYEMWQAYCYLAMAYLKVGQVQSARNAAAEAEYAAPGHPEPDLRIAEAAMTEGELGRAIFYIERARTKRPAPNFVFTNPLDLRYNSRMILAEAYGRLGRIPDARRELQEAQAIIPNEKVGAEIARYQTIEKGAQQSEAFLTLIEGKGDDEILALFDQFKPTTEISKFGRVLDVVMPRMIARRPTSQPKMVIYCGRTLEPWYPGTLNTTGIGGSETAVVEIARRFAADGWRVDVYAWSGQWEGVHEGVGYWDQKRYREQPCDLFVSWRQPRIPRSDQYRAAVLWCHDLNYGPEATSEMGKWDRVLGVSGWHRDYLARAYDLTNADFVPNGVNLNRFDPTIAKKPFQCVYASSPDRGLLQLLNLWPRIAGDEQGAKLVIGYGWDGIDKAIAGHGRGDLADFKVAVQKKMAETSRIEWRGRLPQNELAQLYSESVAWLYPTDFLEVSCISAMESMGAGCVPITSAVGALPDTISNGGLVATGWPYSPAWHAFYVHVARGVLSELNTQKMWQAKARERAKALTWDAAYQKWVALVDDLLSTASRSEHPPVTINGHTNGAVGELEGLQVEAQAVVVPEPMEVA